MYARESILRLLLSLCLAVALWLYLTSRHNPVLVWEYGQALPVSTEGLSGGLALTSDLQPIHVRVRADLRTTPVTPASFHPFVNLAGLGPGLHAGVPVHVVADPGITVVSVTPSRISVAIEQVQTAHVPVRWRILNAPPTGYSVGNVNVDPSTVAISGPESAVQQIHDAAVYIDLSQSRYTVDSFSKPSLQNAQGVTPPSSTRLTVDPQLIHVTVPIVPLRAYKSVPVLATIRGSPKAGVGVVNLVTKPEEVTVSGASSDLARLSTVDTSPVSIAGRAAGTYRDRATLVLPSGLSTRSGRITVVTTLSSVQASSSLQIGVVPQQVPTGLVVRVRPASVLVTVVGSVARIRQESGHLRAVVNLAGYGIGTYTATPTIRARGLKISSVYPSAVTVTLARS